MRNTILPIVLIATVSVPVGVFFAYADRRRVVFSAFTAGVPTALLRRTSGVQRQLGMALIRRSPTSSLIPVISVSGLAATRAKPKFSALDAIVF